MSTKSAVKALLIIAAAGLTQPLPPDMSVLGGLYTSNGSWAAALYHQNSLAADRIRFKTLSLPRWKGSN